MHDTITRAPALPEIDSSTAAQLGDEILLDVAKRSRTKKVDGSTTRRTGAIQSGESRAWTRGGDVD